MECPECGQTISDRAADCPSCGTSVRSVSVSAADDDDESDGGSERTAGDAGQPTGTDREAGSRGDDSPGDGSEPATDRETVVGADGSDPDDADEAEHPGAGETETGPSATEESGGAERARDVEPDAADDPDRGGDADRGDHDAGDSPAGGRPPEGEDRQAPPGGQAGQDEQAAQGPRDAQGTAAAASGHGTAGGQPPGGQKAGGRPPGGQTAGGGPGGGGPPPGGPGGPAGGQGAPQGSQPQEGPGGPGGPGGHGTARGSGFDAKIRELPLKLSAAAGLGGAILVLVVSVVIALAYPSELTSQISDTDLAILTLFDLHFVPPEGVNHVTPFLNGHFDEFSAPPSAFGLLYLIPVYLLYRAGKTVVRTHDDDMSLQDSALSGGAIVIAYLPVMVVAALLAPSTPEIEVALAAFLAGLLYPVLFGAIGGLIGRYYYEGELRAGLGYALSGGVLLLVLVFLSTYATISDIPSGAETLLGRIITTFLVTMGALTLDLGASGIGLLPYVFAIGIFFGAGFVRVQRGSGAGTGVEAFAKGATLAPVFALFVGFVFSVCGLLASEYLIIEELPDAYVVVSAAVESDAIGAGFGEGIRQIGAYVEAVLISTLVYGVVLAGAGGAVARWYEQKQQPGYQQGGRPQQPQQPR